MYDIDVIFDKLASKGGKKALVIGVYTGKEATKLQERGFEVTGTDILPHYITTYKHVKGPFEEVDFGDEKFDVIFSSHVLEHMENVGIALKKMQSLLSSEGWMGIVVPGYPQDSFHVGHYTLWTPALLLYNLFSNGWSCKDAEFMTTEDQKHVIVVLPNKTHTLKGKGWDLINELNDHMPVPLTHKMNAWLADKWKS